MCMQTLNHSRHSRIVTPDIVAFLQGLKNEMRDAIGWEQTNSDFTFKIMYQIAYCQYMMARGNVNAADSTQKKDEKSIKQICDNQFDDNTSTMFIYKCIERYTK